MDQPPVEHEAAKGAAQLLGQTATWIVWILVSIVSGSLTAIQRAGTIKVALYWVVLSSLIGPGIAVVAVVYWDVNVYVGAVICLVAGLGIAGIAKQVEKFNNRVGDANLKIPMLSEDKALPPTPPKEPGK